MQPIESLRIRQFAADDRPLVEAFFDGLGVESRAFFDRADGNRRGALRFFEQKSEDAIRWMAVDEAGRMVGYVFLWDVSRGVPWLGVAVADAYQGRRLGGRLLAHAHDHARDAGKGGIFLTTHVANLRAQSLYERVGYERLGMHSSGEVLYVYRF